GNRAADVFEIDVDAIRYSFSKFCSKIIFLIVDTCIETKRFSEVIDLFRAAGYADNLRTFYLCNLAYDRADCAGCRRDDHSLTFLRLADVQKTAIGRLSRHAECAQVQMKRHISRRDFIHSIFRYSIELLPREYTRDNVSFREILIIRFSDPADNMTFNRFIQFKRLGI